MIDSTALNAHVDSIRDRNEAVAMAGCFLVDCFRESRCPDDLAKLKDFVRLGLQDAGARLRVLHGRDGRRSTHFSARIRRKPALGRRLQGHTGTLHARVALLESRQELLHQIADAGPWVMFNFDIRRLVPLFKESTHDLPEDVGLLGVVQVQADLDATGQFLTMENDLTRVCGIGDVTVARTDGRRSTPLMIEVKTREPDDGIYEGAEIEILTLLVTTNHPRDQETFESLSRVLGGSAEGQMKVSTRAERQAAEIVKRTELIVRTLSSGATVVAPPARNWRPLRLVIDRAMTTGFAVDVAEPGVIYFAVRVGEGNDLSELLQSAKRRAKDILGPKVMAGATIQLSERPELSGVIPPIALWDLPLEQRAALLSNRIVAGTYVASGIYEDLFREQGIELSESDGGWRLVAAGGEEGGVGPLHLDAIRLGTVIGALSPRSVVSVLTGSLKPAA